MYSKTCYPKVFIYVMGAYFVANYHFLLISDDLLGVLNSIFYVDFSFYSLSIHISLYENNLRIFTLCCMHLRISFLDERGHRHAIIY